MGHLAIGNLAALVVAMGAVTYLPRMLPMVLLQNIRLSPFVKRFFQFIPYSALSALIFPDIFFSTGQIGSAIAGGVVSILLAFLRLNLVLVVLGGILGVFFWQLL